MSKHQELRVVAIIQARMSSTRLPGKVLMPILDKPILLHMIERVQRARQIDKIIVATSMEPSDDPIAEAMVKAGIPCHRGPLNDVLQRYCGAVRAIGAPTYSVMRLTGDCPLIDWRVLDKLVDLFWEKGVDYASNVRPQTFPEGLDAEIFTVQALERACDEANNDYEREHVTPFFYRTRPELFSQTNLFCQTGDFSNHRWTLDMPEDFKKIRRIFEALRGKKPDFDMEDILDWLADHPETERLNANIT